MTKEEIFQQDLKRALEFIYGRPVEVKDWSPMAIDEAQNLLLYVDHLESKGIIKFTANRY